MKKIKKIMLIILLGVIITSTLNISFRSVNKVAVEALSNAKASRNTTSQSQGLVVVANKLKPNSTNKNVMRKNTQYLQEYIDKVSNAKGGKVKIPAGKYYFLPNTQIVRGISQYIIKCKDNVIIEGSGISEKSGTILKPYAPNNKVPVDMFYFNEYADSNRENATYLKNADFKNFIIDGENAYSSKYTSAGKGFMINLFENCDWERVVVKNTDGTGFGVDCPINSTIKSCIAINCGKGGKPYGATAPGASGIGIGTGYSNNETIYISNCTSIGNHKYGIFFEHQGRFGNGNGYKATDGNSFVVENCVAYGNMYDFGGERANDVTYKKCISKQNVKNIVPFNFGNSSRRNRLENCKVEQVFQDVTNTSSYYYEPVRWALNNGITNGVSKTKFAPKQSTTRAQAVVFLWRMAGMPGDVVYSSEITLKTGFTDVPENASYVDALNWAVAKEQGIVSQSTRFNPNDECKRAEFITMLWRYAGKPKATTKHKFTDVVKGSYYDEAINWAYSEGIVKGTSNGKFNPNSPCTRADAVTMMYRYSTGNC